MSLVPISGTLSEYNTVFENWKGYWEFEINSSTYSSSEKSSMISYANSSINDLKSSCLSYYNLANENLNVLFNRHILNVYNYCSYKYKFVPAITNGTYSLLTSMQELILVDESSKYIDYIYIEDPNRPDISNITNNYIEQYAWKYYNINAIYCPNLFEYFDDGLLNYSLETTETYNIFKSELDGLWDTDLVLFNNFSNEIENYSNIVSNYLFFSEPPSFISLSTLSIKDLMLYNPPDGQLGLSDLFDTFSVTILGLYP